MRPLSTPYEDMVRYGNTSTQDIHMYILWCDMEVCVVRALINRE